MTTRGPDVDARHRVLVRLWRRGNVKASDLVALLLQGDDDAAEYPMSDAAIEARCYLHTLESAGRIKHLYNEIYHPELLHHYAPNYEDKVIPDIVRHAWPPCPKCLARDAIARRHGGGLAMRCSFCKHVDWLRLWDAAEEARTRLVVVPRRRGWKPTDKPAESCPDNMSPELFAWLKKRPPAVVSSHAVVAKPVAAPPPTTAPLPARAGPGLAKASPTGERVAWSPPARPAFAAGSRR